jgi:hypothetical protein
MKNSIARLLFLVSITTMFAGCAWEVGSGPKQVTVKPTIGQQLIDLQKAKESGALTDSEYQLEKAKVLGSK